MANSLITLNQKKLWIHDDTFIIILDFLVLELEKLQALNKNVDPVNIYFRSYISKLNYFIKGFSAGGIDLYLEEIYIDKERLEIFHIALQNMIKELDKFGTSIDCDYLNSIEAKRIGEKIFWQEPMDVASLKKIITEIQKLLL